MHKSGTCYFIGEPLNIEIEKIFVKSYDFAFDKIIGLFDCRLISLVTTVTHFT